MNPEFGLPTSEAPAEVTMLFRNRKPAAAPDPIGGWTQERLQAIARPIRPNSREFEIKAAAYRQSLTIDECSRKLYGTMDLIGTPGFPVPASITFEVLDPVQHAERLKGWVPGRPLAREPSLPRVDNFRGYVTLEEVDDLVARCACAVFQCLILVEPDEWSMVREVLRLAATAAYPPQVSVRVEFPDGDSQKRIDQLAPVPQWGITRYWINTLVTFDRAAATNHPELRLDDGA